MRFGYSKQLGGFFMVVSKDESGAGYRDGGFCIKWFNKISGEILLLKPKVLPKAIEKKLLALPTAKQMTEEFVKITNEEEWSQFGEELYTK